MEFIKQMISTPAKSPKIGGHENSAFVEVKSVRKHLSEKKEAFSYLKSLFHTTRILPEIKK